MGGRVGGWSGGGRVSLSDTKARRCRCKQNVALRSSIEHLYGLGFGSGPFLGIWVAKLDLVGHSYGVG